MAVLVLLLVVLFVVIAVEVVVDHHILTSPLAVAARPVVSKGSFRRSRSSLSRSSSW